MKLRHRYSLGIFLIGSLCIAAMLTDRALSTQKLLGERAEARAEAIASAVAREIIDPLQRGDDKTVLRRLRIFSELKGVERVQVVAMNGKVTHGFGRRFGHPDEAALHRTGRELFEGPMGEPRTVEVSITADGFKRAIFPLLVRGTLWGGASLFLLGLTSWWLGKRAGRKLEDLVSAVPHIDDDTARKLPDLANNSEIGALSRAFQELHRRLKHESSQRMRLEEQRDDMTNMLVHDLKHPLTVLRMALAILNDAPASSRGRQQATALSLAARSSIRMEAMIDGVLQVARLDHAEAPPTFERTPISQFMENCASENEVVVTGSGRPWRLEVAPELSERRMFSHPMLLRRLVGNLVLNAIDHSPEGTPVTLGARRSEDDASRVEIYVSNDSSQLQLEPNALLREKYQSSGEKSHAGLGLAFCRMAAKLHSSSLDVSQHEDNRVVFSVDIPMGPAEYASAPNIKEAPVHETA